MAGLRGLVTLVRLDVYRKALHENAKLVDIIDKIDFETELGCQASTYVFMICGAIISLEGRLKDHEQLVQKFIHLPSIVDVMSSPEGQFWGLFCFLSAVIVSDNRVSLMKTQLPKLMPDSLNKEAKKQLIEKCIDAYIAMANDQNADRIKDVDDIMKHKSIVTKLFDRLDGHDGVAALRLISVIAGDDPKMIFDDFLTPSWPKLLNLLDSDDNDKGELVIDILCSLSNSPVPKKKGSLPGADHGVHLVQVLAKEITGRRIAILLFLWTHYSDAEDAFINGNIIQSMLALYDTTEEDVKNDISEKVKKLICFMLIKERDDSARIQDKIVHSFDNIIRTVSGRDVVNNNLSVVLELILCCIQQRQCSRIPNWLLEDGLGKIVQGLIGKILSESTKETVTDIFMTVINSQHPLNKKTFSKLFIWTFKAAEVTNVPFLMGFLSTKKWLELFGNLEGQEHFEIPVGVTFDRLTSQRMRALIMNHRDDRTGFVSFMCHVLVQMNLERVEILDYLSSERVDVRVPFS